MSDCLLFFIHFEVTDIFNFVHWCVEHQLPHTIVINVKKTREQNKKESETMKIREQNELRIKKKKK